MSSRRMAAVLAILSFGGFPAIASAPVPRKSPELTIVEPSGKQTRLSSFMGRVVVIEFIITKCPHCLRVAQTMAKLDWELRPRGLQTIGVAFDSGVNGQMVGDFMRQFAVRYPIGFTASKAVDGYLGRAADERFALPQIVVIDRGGVIRAQSRPIGERNLEDENYLRDLIERLLRENPAKDHGGAARGPS